MGFSDGRVSGEPFAQTAVGAPDFPLATPAAHPSAREPVPGVRRGWSGSAARASGVRNPTGPRREADKPRRTEPTAGSRIRCNRKIRDPELLAQGPMLFRAGVVKVLPSPHFRLSEAGESGPTFAKTAWESVRLRMRSIRTSIPGGHVTRGAQSEETPGGTKRRRASGSCYERRGMGRRWVGRFWRGLRYGRPGAGPF